VQLILGRVAEVATLFDDDGIVIRFMVRTPAVQGGTVQPSCFARCCIHA
jgi:hypothetical protein